ncbi:hypothetical protein GWK08_13220 [Leptobacterium flavescens]|uniref:DUF6265 domain-containing protein n=1 Tax=Leptobacterium flavescens TaxID=472055 RepID=A0A6P0UQX9_9FLAO|nr:DUF6265 family protein [Leptobacterium flavescens]NER14408.1 hypothetical protein [Leptobacterium flavescens]
MKKVYPLLFLMALFTVQSCAQDNKLRFLEGTWKVENKETYEEWKADGKDGLTGRSYRIRDGKEITTERLQIRKDKKDIIYTATVLNQNQGKGIDFKLNREIKEVFAFENPEHDFPKKIIYTQIGDNKLQVKVLGENDKGFILTMIKQ